MIKVHIFCPIFQPQLHGIRNPESYWIVFLMQIFYRSVWVFLIHFRKYIDFKKIFILDIILLELKSMGAVLDRTFVSISALFFFLVLWKISRLWARSSALTSV